MLDSVSAVFNAITGMRAENTSVPRPADLKDNPWVPPPDGRCIINELPTELLAYIFELGYIIEKEQHTSNANDDDSDDGRSLDTLSHSSSGSTSDERHLPVELLVSRVCQRWRSVALALPVLWTSLEFKDPLLNFEQQKAYLERAKGAPLDISIDCTFEEEDDQDEHDVLQTEAGRSESRVYGEVKQVVDIIVPHALQWRSLEVMVSHYLLMQLVLEALGSLSDGAPLLEVLQLYHYEDDTEDPDTFRYDWLKEQNFILFHNKVPKLSHVALWGVHLNWPKTTFLSGLHELELAYHAQDVRPSYRDFLRMLKTSPDLITLALYDSGPAGGPVEWLSSVSADPLNIGEDHDMSTPSSYPTSSPNTSDPSPTMYTLTSLRNLILSYHPAEYAIGLLDRLPTPSLHSLALDFDDDQTLNTAALLTRLYSPHPSFSSSSSRSILGTIEALKLSGLRTYDPAVVLRAGLTLTNLTQLNINVEHVDWTWVDVLTDPLRAAAETSVASGSGEAPDPTVTASTVACPRLTILTVSGLEGRILRELIEARRKAGHPILELYVDEEEPLDADEVVWFRENVDVFEFFQGSEDGFEDDDDASVFEVDLEEDEWGDEDDVEDEVDGDEDEWTDED